MEPLTAQQITDRLAQSRNRGGHERFVRKFVASGEMYAVVNEDRMYRGKTADQLDTSVKSGLLNAAKKVDGGEDIKVIWADPENRENLLIINTSVVGENLPEDE